MFYTCIHGHVIVPLFVIDFISYRSLPLSLVSFYDKFVCFYRFVSL